MTKRNLWRALGGSALLCGSLIAGIPSANAATYCAPGSGSSSGRCWEATNVARRVVVVEDVPVENFSSKTGTFSCSFSTTITRTVEAGVSVSASVSASLFKVVDASTSITVTASVSQSASRASSVVGTFTLKPGERVSCQRTYGYVSASVREYTYTQKGTTTVRRYNTTVPSSLGVRLVD